MKSDELAKSMLADFAGQAMGVILQAKQEMSDRELEIRDELNEARMRIEDLEEEKEKLTGDFEAKAYEVCSLESQLREAIKSRDEYYQWWIGSLPGPGLPKMSLQKKNKPDDDASDSVGGEVSK